MSVREVEQAAVTVVTEALELEPVAWENWPLDTDGIDGPWYRVTSLPGQPTTPGVGELGARRHTGIVQVDVFWPRAQGDGPAKAKADDIIGAFSIGRNIGGGVVQNAYRSGGRIDGSWYHIPITVAYRVDVIQEEGANNE